MKFLIEALFQSESADKKPDSQHLLRVATATLLLEVVRADFEVDQREMSKVRQVLRQFFELNENELDQMIAEAGDQADRLVSLQHITRQLNEQFDETEKIRVIEMMWQVVFADGNLDHYEEHLIRQALEREQQEAD